MSNVPDVQPTVQPTSTKYPVRYPLTVSHDMDEKLTQLLGRLERGTSRNDLIPLALRQYIDDQEDVIGSRRHFSNSLQHRLDPMELQHVFYRGSPSALTPASHAPPLPYDTQHTKVQSR